MKTKDCLSPLAQSRRSSAHSEEIKRHEEKTETLAYLHVYEAFYCFFFLFSFLFFLKYIYIFRLKIHQLIFPLRSKRFFKVRLNKTRYYHTIPLWIFLDKGMKSKVSSGRFFARRMNGLMAINGSGRIMCR